MPNKISEIAAIEIKKARDEADAANEALLEYKNELGAANEALLESKNELDAANKMLVEQMNVLEESRKILQRHAMVFRKSEHQFRAFTATAPNAIISTDSVGLVTSWNKAAESIFGWTKDEMKGKPLSSIMPERHRKPHDTAVQKIASNLESKIEINRIVELEAIRKDGSEFPVELAISSWWVDDEVFFGGIIRDITEKVEAAKRDAQYVADLQEARTEAILSNKTKSEFLANMSHELRTPLNAVIGFSEIMLSEVFGKLNDRHAEYTADILNSGKHLLNVINDVLDLSKIEAGHLELSKEDINLSDIMNSCHILIKERAHDKNLSIVFDFDEDVIFMGDEIRIKQIILNLLTNAVKFTNAGGRISVTARDETNHVYIVVNDTGIGMNNEGLMKALTKFSQVDSVLTREQEGTGLGLPIAKELIELHGGTLELESELGVGTTVTVILPKS